jgi:hypothetical protein
MSEDQVSAAVLAAPMEKNDAEAASVGDYLIRLLTGVWEEGEGFDGKRPFGNSSWEEDIYLALVRAGLVGGVINAQGYLDDVDDATANTLVTAAIRSLYPAGAGS